MSVTHPVRRFEEYVASLVGTLNSPATVTDLSYHASIIEQVRLGVLQQVYQVVRQL